MSVVAPFQDSNQPHTHTHLRTTDRWNQEKKIFHKIIKEAIYQEAKSTNKRKRDDEDQMSLKVIIVRRKKTSPDSRHQTCSDIKMKSRPHAGVLHINSDHHHLIPNSISPSTGNHPFIFMSPITDDTWS